MTRHYNPSIINRAARILNSKGNDFLPDEVSGPVATIAISPKVDIVRAGTATGTSTTIYTTPTDKDFYLTGIQLAMIKDATSTSTSTNIDCQINGTTAVLINIPSFTLTAQTLSENIQYIFPIKVDRGTALRVRNSTGTANITSIGTIYGYTEETTQN
jgi:hypothetical protein